MSTLTRPLQILSISTSLLAAGGISTLSLFDIPAFKSQPASRSLPMTRWLFSRGSHIFPTAAILSSAGFSYLAYTALPLALRRRGLLRAVTHLLKLTTNTTQVNSYIAAAILTIAIAPFTTLVMLPTNFRLIQLNEELGGARSSKAAEAEKNRDGAVRSAEQSVNSEGMPSQFTDLSGPQERTEQEASEAQEREVKNLLGRFEALNWVRAGLMTAGGIVGLIAAL